MILQPLIVLEMGGPRSTALTGGRQESGAVSRQVNVEQGGTGEGAALRLHVAPERLITGSPSTEGVLGTCCLPPCLGKEVCLTKA